MTYVIEPVWAGKTCIIIGGGSSFSVAQARTVAMARFDDRCRVIAVNDAVYPAWWADWLHAADFKFWNWHVQRLQHFKGIKTTVDDAVPSGWITGKLARTGIDGFDRQPWALRGNNGGYQAICAAMHAGAERILLLGFDMRGPHWFAGHPDGINDRADGWSVYFETLLPFLKERAVSVINCSPGSALKCFPAGDLTALI